MILFRRSLGIVLVSVMATLLSGCNPTNMLFETIMFAGAERLPADADRCPHPHRSLERSCEKIGDREVFLSSLDEDVKLQGLFFPNPSSNRLILYFHGNSGHVYHRIPDMIELSKIANAFILSYRGYGKSQGSPSEVGLYRDARAAVRYARDELGFPKDRIYLYGRSLGAAVAVDVAQDGGFAGMILVTPFLSGRAIAKTHPLGWIPGLGPLFDSENKFEGVTFPALFIHGTNDALVPYEQGVALYERYPAAKQFKRIEGAVHNDIVDRAGDDYWRWLRDFVAR